MNATSSVGEEKPASTRRTLAEIIASVKQKEVDEPQAVAAEVSAFEPTVEPPSMGSPSVGGNARRATNGTRRFKGVMVELSPSMIKDLDSVADGFRRSRSDLIREAVRVWLKGKGPKT